MSRAIKDIKIGDQAPEEFPVVIEISKGSHNKYEFDEIEGVFKLDRVLYSPLHYPLDYGFIPETRSEDGDHLDALVIGSDPVPLGVVVKARPIAVFEMIDGGDLDAKILAVQVDNPRFNEIKSLEDFEKFSGHTLKEIAHFFKVYKDLQDKKVEVIGWKDKAAALVEIKKAMNNYSS